MQPKPKGPDLAIMIAPESSAPAKASASPTDQTVPLAALEVDNVAPAVGDEVEFRVKAKVTAINGQTAQVMPTAINDQPLDQPAPAEGADVSDDAMMDEAMKSDKS